MLATNQGKNDTFHLFSYSARDDQTLTLLSIWWSAPRTP
jgi:hypothetical protein